MLISFNIFLKEIKPIKFRRLGNPRNFQAKTQRTSSKSSEMDFKTHSIFSIFAKKTGQNKLKVAQNAPETVPACMII